MLRIMLRKESKLMNRVALMPCMTGLFGVSYVWCTMYCSVFTFLGRLNFLKVDMLTGS